MSTRQEEFQKFLDQQRLEYQRTLPLKVADLQTRWSSVQAGKEVAEQMVTLERMAHTLAGTAGTFGFLEVGLAAREIEGLLEKARTATELSEPGFHAGMELALARLHGSVQQLS